MKVFDREEGFEYKVNFVDSNNVVLGYDMSQSGCEDYGWWISDSPHPRQSDKEFPTEALVGFVFDKSYREYTSPEDKYDDGGTMTFKAVKDGEVLYIHLYNLHNGYYSHGFTFEDGDHMIEDGRL